MQKKKILITGGKGMLAYDFFRTQKEKYDIILVDRDECDITSFVSIMQCITLHEPHILLNCAAYTAVDDAEDIGMKACFDVNTLGVKNLAKATSAFGIDFITISTDYVFDGENPNGYVPTDMPNPIGIYGMSKYLGERLALDENPRTIIVRTSWLYGGDSYFDIRISGIEKTENRKMKNGPRIFKNFVNTMLQLSESKAELKVVSDQHGIPTSSIDLSFALAELIDSIDDSIENGDNILHFSNSCSGGGITWAEFKRDFHTVGKDISIVDCISVEYPTKARRPNYSILKNTSEIILDDWREGLHNYLKK